MALVSGNLRDSVVEVNRVSNRLIDRRRCDSSRATPANWVRDWCQGCVLGEPGSPSLINRPGRTPGARWRPEWTHRVGMRQIWASTWRASATTTGTESSTAPRPTILLRPTPSSRRDQRISSPTPAVEERHRSINGCSDGATWNWRPTLRWYGRTTLVHNAGFLLWISNWTSDSIGKRGQPGRSGLSGGSSRIN